MKHKGEFGYITGRKKRALLISLILLGIAVAIFVTGLLLNDMSKANIFTVVAVVFVLPWAKQLVALIVLFPYHSVEKKEYEQVKKIVPPNAKLYTDLVISSSEKIMFLKFAVIGGDSLIALSGGKKEDFSDLRKYIVQGAANWGDYKVHVLDNESQFKREVQNLDAEQPNKNENRVTSYLLSLVL